MTVFFDSHGGAHVTCDPSHPEARAFGPTGSSKEATEADLASVGLEVPRGVTDYTAAWRAGRLVRGEEPHEFDTLAEGATRDRIAGALLDALEREIAEVATDA